MNDRCMRNSVGLAEIPVNSIHRLCVFLSQYAITTYSGSLKRLSGVIYITL